MSATIERPRVAVILAAGKGTRMKSERPKVLHEAGGRPLLGWVIAAARQARCERILVVIGYGAEAIQTAFPGDDLTWVVQHEQLGTGHALAQAADALGTAQHLLLVLSGDVPLLTPSTLERLADAASTHWGAMAVAEVGEPGRLGRVVARDEGAHLLRIVEAADASAGELALREVNAGLYALPAPEIFSALDDLTTDNAQGEYYLTQALNEAAARGEQIELVRLENPHEALGVNTRAELAAMHRLLLDRYAAELMSSGVTLLEPSRTTIEPGVRIGPDTVIHPDVCLLGETSIGAGCTLHQGAWLRDSILGDGVVVEPYSVLDRAQADQGCRVGPFARLRPATRLLRGARVGNFVEVKASQLGEDSRVGHLAYLGDAEVGARANIGAGTITCNFDGREKHRTHIGQNAFIGSDTQLVAPVSVGDGASTAAGSVITRDVPSAALAVGRSRQRNLAGRAAGLSHRRKPGADEPTPG